MNEDIKLKEAKERYLLVASIFGILGLIVIPILTINFAFKVDFYKENISVAAAIKENRLYHIFLISFISVYFYSFIYYILKLTENLNHYTKRIINIACPSLLISALFEYKPLEKTFMAQSMSQIHVIFSFGGVLLYLAAIISILYHLRFFDPRITRITFVIGEFILFACFINFVVFKVINGLVEVFVVIMIPFIFMIVLYLIYKSKAFNLVDYYEYHKNQKNILK